MSAIPEELLLFSQIFGALPLAYSKNPKSGPSLELSKALYVKHVVVVLLLTILSVVSLWVDYDAYLRGRPLRMVHFTNVVAIFLDVTFLNLMSLAVFLSNLRYYYRFVNLCYVLERTDRALRLAPNHRPWRFKVVLMGLYVTSMIVNTETTLFSVGWKGIWHLFDLLHYYVQGALFLQFTFVVTSITGRFRSVNQMIEREVVELCGRQARGTRLVNTTTAPEGYLLEDRLKLLIDSYSRLCEAVQLANSFYSSQLFGALSSSFIHNIITLYLFIQEVRPSNDTDDGSSMVNEMVWMFTHIAHLILFVWPCTRLTDAVSDTAPMVCRLLSREVGLHNTAAKQQLETFLLELLHYNVGFSALGFFEVHNHILTTIASSVTTYLVIMIQFRSSDS